MKVAIVGAGAVGGYVGAKLARAGEHVTFMARGTNLQVLRDTGITLLLPDGTTQGPTHVSATDDYPATGHQDLLILAVKAHQLEAVAAPASHLIGPHTLIVTMQNGIPYWYFHQYGGALSGHILTSVDPSGHIARHIPASQVIGCVVYPAAEQVAPGIVRLIEGDRFPVGEPDGSVSERARTISACFEKAGFKSPVLASIRAEIWLKLWGNLAFNPISALTRSTLADICEDTGARQLAFNMMSEAQRIGESLGITFRVPIDKRIAGAAKVGHHKTSMLQDLEAGRTLEIDALLGAVTELGRLTGIRTPHLDAIYALTRRLSHTIR